MQTQAYFDDIQLHIIHELNKARNSLVIAVAWFTDSKIFDALCEKAASGVRVELMLANDRINDKSCDDQERLIASGGIVTLAGTRGNGKTLMHNKFCVIDGTTIVTGSFNWSKKAQQNDENITVITDAAELARQFIAEFESIKARQSSSDKESADPLKILSRMEALRHVITLDDEDDISLQLQKLKRLIPVSGGYDTEQAIIALVESDELETASIQIEEYCRTHKQVAVYVDPELDELRLELTLLEIQVAAMEDEKAEIERVLHAFNFRYSIELGEVISRILQLRTERLQHEYCNNPDKEEEYQEARKDYEDFTKDQEESRQNPVAELLPEEQQELKATFRACTKLCHPDMVALENKDDATRLFARLNEANEKNDLNAVKEIYEQLKQGFFAPMSSTVSDTQKLMQQIVRLRSRLTAHAQATIALRISPPYKAVSEIGDWDIYFAEMKQKFQQELYMLETANEQQ